MHTVSKISRDPLPVLSISDLAEQTGLTATTVRTWESRHGFPTPLRLPGRHRRYTDEHVSLVRQVLQRRADGLTLEAAIAEVTSGPRATDRSIYAGLRRLHPQLTPQTLRKSTLLSLTHAMEDECCARAQDPVLLASFQHERFFAASRARYRDLARTSRSSVVFADFAARTRTRSPSLRAASSSPAPAEPVTVHLPDSTPLRREWSLVCDAPDYPVCLSAWELPGQERVRDRDRVFEAVWSLDPAVVRDACRIGLALAHELAPELASILPEPPTSTPPRASDDLRAATTLFTRMLGYVDHRS